MHNPKWLHVHFKGWLMMTLILDVYRKDSLEVTKLCTTLTVVNSCSLKHVINLAMVFFQAIGEPVFSVAYANMCRCLFTVIL